MKFNIEYKRGLLSIPASNFKELCYIQARLDGKITWYEVFDNPLDGEPNKLGFDLKLEVALECAITWVLEN